MSQPEAVASPRLTRRTCLKAGLGLAALAAQGPWPTILRAEAARRPQALNVLLLMCDQHRPNALSRYGDPYALTPTLDGLAASGLSLREAYCQSPVCVSSRNAILTSRYPHSSGVYSNGFRANRNMISFAQVLRGKGYRTACFGKLHTPGREDLDWDECDESRHSGAASAEDLLDGGLNALHGAALGAPAPYPESETMEWRAREHAVAFMKVHRDRPWLIQCSFKRPHPPFQPPKAYWDKIDPSKLVVPRFPPDDLADGNPRYLEGMKKRGMEKLTDDQVKAGMRGYYGNLAFADAMFANVLKALDDLGLRDRTLVIYNADHGEMLNEHGLWTKMVFFDPSVRVPMIVRLPGVTPEGKDSRALVELIDIFPTIMDAVGLESPAGVQGRSLMPLLAGKTDKHRDVVRSEFPQGRGPDYEPTMMQFDGRYKVVDNGPSIPPELYDHQTDPHEFTNLQAVPEQKERLSRMLADLRTWIKQDVVTNPSGHRGQRRQSALFACPERPLA